MLRSLIKARDTLLARRRELATRAGAQADAEASLSAERPSDLVDGASVTESIEEIEHLRRGELEELVAVEGALVRIARGTYGVCRGCGRKIAVRRLAAVPWTDMCRTCRTRAESREQLTR